MIPMIKAITDKLTVAAHVNGVFGEPRQIGRKTIIPIAAVGLGFGVGRGRAGRGREAEGEEEAAQEGGGGGGGGGAKPLAVLEVTDEETRLIPVVDLTRVIVASLMFATAATCMITKLIGRLQPRT